MNRRQFSTSAVAALTTPLAPVSGVLAAPTAPALPARTYLWADFIAQARGHVDAGFLARRLGLNAAQADAVMGELLQNGAIHPAELGGVARAAKPLQFPTHGTGGMIREMTASTEQDLKAPRDLLNADEPMTEERLTEPDAPEDPDQGSPIAS